MLLVGVQASRWYDRSTLCCLNPWRAERAPERKPLVWTDSKLAQFRISGIPASMKSRIVFLLLLSNTAWPFTTVVAYRSHDQLLLAADSKFGVFSPKTHAGGRKIKQSNDVFFAPSGLVQDAQTKFYVDQIARTALRPPGAMVKRANRLEP